MDENAAVTIRNLWLPLEDEATYYFFHNFASDDSGAKNSLNAYADVLPTLYQQKSSFGTLPKIIDAIGLASISNIKHSPELMVAAGQEYAKALRAINASIQDPRKATKDETMAAVMLLGLFEVFDYLENSFLFQFDRFADRHMFSSRICEISGKPRQWCNYDSTPTGN